MQCALGRIDIDLDQGDLARHICSLVIGLVPVAYKYGFAGEAGGWLGKEHCTCFQVQLDRCGHRELYHPGFKGESLKLVTLHVKTELRKLVGHVVHDSYFSFGGDVPGTDGAQEVIVRGHLFGGYASGELCFSIG